MQLVGTMGLFQLEDACIWNIKFILTYHFFGGCFYNVHISCARIQISRRT